MKWKLGVVNVNYGGNVNSNIILLFQVLEVMKKCITSISCSGKLDEAILDRLLSDSSIHSTLFRIVCTTTQALEVGYAMYLFILFGDDLLSFVLITNLGAFFCRDFISAGLLI